VSDELEHARAVFEGWASEARATRLSPLEYVSNVEDNEYFTVRYRGGAVLTVSMLNAAVEKARLVGLADAVRSRTFAAMDEALKAAEAENERLREALTELVENAEACETECEEGHVEILRWPLAHARAALHPKEHTDEA